MNTLIIDDDFLFCTIIQNKLSTLFEKDSISLKIDICNQHFENIDMQKYDLYFIDIILPIENGIDLGKKILMNNPRAILVFMSVDNNNVFDTFPLDHFYYIRKSNLDDDLNKFRIKLFDKYGIVTFVSHYQEIQIFQKDIIMIESKRNKLSIITNFEKYTVYDSLSHFIKNLNSHHFYRLYSYCVINLAHIRNFQNDGIVLSQGYEIPYGRKKNQLKEAYMEYRRMYF